MVASERYTTRLEALLGDRLGITFADRPGTPAGKRPVLEIVGVDARLLRGVVAPPSGIDARRAQLAVRAAEPPRLG